MQRLFASVIPALLSASLAAQVEVITGVFPRSTTTAVWFESSKRKTLCRASLEHGAPLWKAEYRLEDCRGKRLRFGSGAFAQLHLTHPVRIGGTAVAAGKYALVLDCGPTGKWSLVILDEQEVTAKKIPPSRANQTVGSGILLPLQLRRRDDATARLAAAFEKTPDGTRLAIRWGPHELTAAIACRR